MIVFVGGVGRSGTHMLGRLLATHKDVQVRLESGMSFDNLAKLASDPDISCLERILRKIFILLDLSRFYFSRDWTVEKTHSSIWSAAFLFRCFPKSKMIIMERDQFSVLASMKVHEGVNKWYEILPQDKVNPFLGISIENRGTFRDSHVLYKYWVKWKSHIDMGRKLRKEFPDNVLIVHYENIVLKQLETLQAICTFLDLKISDLDLSKISDKSLDKWKIILSEEEVKIIKQFSDEG